MKRFEIRKATREDMLDFYGPDNPWRIEAWTAWYEGQRAAIAGISFNEFGNIVFSDYKRNIKAPRMTAFKACKALMDEIRKTRVRCMTVCFPRAGENVPAERAARFLELMGFRYSHWVPDGYAIFELEGR